MILRQLEERTSDLGKIWESGYILYKKSYWGASRLSKKSFVGSHMARDGRPLRGQTRLAPLAKRSTCSKSREQGMARWWERSPPTNVARVQIPASTPYVGWVCCWFSPLLRDVFLRVLRFSPLLKNQHFQRRTPLWMCYLQIVICYLLLSIYLYYVALIFQ